MTGSISLLPPHTREEKNIWMFQELNTGELAPQPDALSITPAGYLAYYSTLRWL